VAHVADGIAYTVLCPDCGETFADQQTLVAHREAEHPPALTVVSGAGGISSRAQVAAPGEKER
jgi:hypothetical protein